MDDTPVEPALPDADLAVAAAAPGAPADLHQVANNISQAGAIYQKLAAQARAQNDTSKGQDFSDTADFLLDSSEFLRSIAGIVVVEA